MNLLPQLNLILLLMVSYMFQYLSININPLNASGSNNKDPVDNR